MNIESHALPLHGTFPQVFQDVNESTFGGRVSLEALFDDLSPNEIVRHGLVLRDWLFHHGKSCVLVLEVFVLFPLRIGP